MIYTKDVINFENASIDSEDEIGSKQKHATSSILEIGKKLLHCAREGDSQGVVELLGKGAPITTDWLGTSPLHLAVMNNHYGTCELLLHAGVGKDGRTKVDRTPLHFAAYEGHFEIARLLLEHGAEVDCRDMLRMTPLHWAVERRHQNCVHVLLKFGARVDSISRFNKTPLSIAIELNWTEMIDTLEKWNIVDLTQTVENMTAKDTKHSITKFSSDYDEILHLNNEKSMDDNDNIHEMETDSIDTEKDAQTVLASLLPQVEDVPNEATLQLLKEHGITMLPTDSMNTVNSAIQCGRKIVLSDAGKLVLKDVNLHKELLKPVEIKKPHIVLPSTKMKNTKIYKMSSSQFLAMTAQAKPNILQKLPIETLKKAASSAGLNFVQLPKNASISPIKTSSKNIKIINNVPIKAVPNLTLVKKPDTTDYDYHEASKLGHIPQAKNTKIVKLNIGNTVKIMMKKNSIKNEFADGIIQTDYSTSNDKDMHSISSPCSNMNSTLDNFSLITKNLNTPEENSNVNEIESLKLELAKVRNESEYYKKKLEETYAELLMYKNKINFHSHMDGT